MPQPADKFDEATLPDPELNPLLNPLLAANMGRWAEVYFTSPPERRGEAVAELLRELSGAPPENAPIQVIHNQMRGDRERDDETPPRDFDTSELTHPNPSATRPVQNCDSCGHESPLGQKFCGMCGALLQSSQETSSQQYTESATVIETLDESDFSDADGSVEPISEPAVFPSLPGKIYEDLDSLRSRMETGVPRFALESQSVPSRFRLYIGALLAILLAALLYMAWRGKTGFSGAAQSAPARAIPAELPPATIAPSAAPRASSEPPKSAEDVLLTAPSAAPAGREVQPPADPGKRQNANARPAARVVGVASNSPAIAAEQSGAEELATAEKYLNGNRGNSGEAAPWLWKAVAKGNLTATMTLSDLYLRGDGVPKNCDQARLLLDAAARKGKAAAADRLRNLKVFGCE